MVRLGILALTIAVAGCAKPEVKACEANLLKTLKSPSTYKQISVTSIDSGPMTPATFEEEAGIPKPAEELDRLRLRVFRDRMKGHILGLRQVAIEYDAENAYGAPMRSAAVCAFALRDGKVGDQSELDSAISYSGLHRTRDMLDDVRTLTGQSPGPKRAKPKYDCCLL